MNEASFIVEEAGCESCAARVRSALEPIASVTSIEVDEAADEALVRVERTAAVSEDAVGRALAAASEGAGHAYRVRAGSWDAGGGE
jgi:copper chaperone CopZ